MRYGHSSDSRYKRSDAELLVCELCGEERTCQERDGIVACPSCQQDLLPSGWAL